MSKRYTLGSTSIGPLEKRLVNEVLDNNYISPGPVVAEVEATCARLHDKQHCVSVNSGQSALLIGLQALITKYYRHNDRKPLVAVPACTYISTLAAVIYAGCDLMLVDVEKATGNMCGADLLKVLQRQHDESDPVDFVIPVHLYGKACNPEVERVCKQFDVFVLEDACEATCAVGTGWGDMLATSFFSNHLISGGCGGAVMTNDEELRFYAWKLANHGRAEQMTNDDIYRIADKFRFDCWGHSFKWNDVNAAIVKAQFERIDELYEARDRNALALWTGLWGWQADYHKIILPDMRDHRFMMYPIVLDDDSMDASRVVRHLNDNGIETRHMMPITDQRVVQDYFCVNLDDEFPNAAFINRQGFYVGCHPELSEDDAREMANIIHEALKAECLRHDPNFVAPHEVPQ